MPVSCCSLEAGQLEVWLWTTYSLNNDTSQRMAKEDDWSVRHSFELIYY
jgi:hypothetical protein